jgi:hypothetical protein
MDAWDSEHDRRVAALRLNYRMKLHAQTAKHLEEIAGRDWPEWIKTSAAEATEARHARLMKRHKRLMKNCI